MSTDWRALCAELLPLSSSSRCAEEMVDSAVKSIDRARTALAQPEPEALTVQECNDMRKHRENYIYECSDGDIQLDGCFSREDLLELARTISANQQPPES
jgi:hypothetical protein